VSIKKLYELIIVLKKIQILFIPGWFMISESWFSQNEKNNRFVFWKQSLERKIFKLKNIIKF